jgi:hypothetical protein
VNLWRPGASVDADHMKEDLAVFDFWLDAEEV